MEPSTQATVPQPKNAVMFQLVVSAALRRQGEQLGRPESFGQRVEQDSQGGQDRSSEVLPQDSWHRRIQLQVS